MILPILSGQESTHKRHYRCIAMENGTPARLSVDSAPALNVMLELLATNIKQDVMGLINCQELHILVQKLVLALFPHLFTTHGLC